MWAVQMPGVRFSLVKRRQPAAALWKTKASRGLGAGVNGGAAGGAMACSVL